MWRCSISICHFTQKHVSPRFKFLRIFNQLTVMMKSEYWNELIWSCVESNVRNWWMISTCAMCNPPSAGDLFISSVYLSLTNVCMYVCVLVLRNLNCIENVIVSTHSRFFGEQCVIARVVCVSLFLSWFFSHKRT